MVVTSVRFFTKLKKMNKVYLILYIGYTMLVDDGMVEILSSHAFNVLKKFDLPVSHFGGHVQILFYSFVN